jgi:hypothetical protein
MAHRLITDAAGVSWQVWETRPGPRSKVSPEKRNGWMTFESLTAVPIKRRLAPIVDAWARMSDEELLEMLRRSVEVPASRRLGTAAETRSSRRRAQLSA